MDMPLSLAEVLEKNRTTGRGYNADGSPRALTAQEFFEVSNEAGWNQGNPDYRGLFEHFARWVRANLNIRRSLEIGAGPGYFLYCLNRLGIDARGIDGNEYSRAFFQELHPEYSGQYTLDPLFTGSYGRVDALFSIEVFEHIDDAGLDAIMKKVSSVLKPRYIVFSSTPHADPNPHWDLQWGHINLKQPAQWDDFFGRHGFLRQPGLRPPVTEWATVYRNILVETRLNFSVSYPAMKSR